MTAPARVDHLVIAARDLAQGVAWCEATLGVTPGPGGDHPLMGTHNRLLRIATVNYPQAYLEVIAINPGAPSARPAGARRWFDLDDERLQAAVADEPRLVHFVAQVPDVKAAVAALAAQDLDRGEVIQASRPTPRGLLQWQITVRQDGQRLLDGCLPTLIQWGDHTHPTPTLPDLGVSLHALAVTHPQAPRLQAAFGALGLQGVALQAGPPNLCATLLTPRGPVKLESKGN